MGRIADPKLAKVFTKADHGTPLSDAWRALGEPTSWGHVQRAYKAHRETMAAQPAATSGAGRTPASGADRTLSGAARTPAAAAAATAAPSPRVGKSVAIATRLTPQAALGRAQGRCAAGHRARCFWTLSTIPMAVGISVTQKTRSAHRICPTIIFVRLTF